MTRDGEERVMKMGHMPDLLHGLMLVRRDCPHFEKVRRLVLDICGPYTKFIAALLEAWEMAPWPQVRLYVDGQNPFDEAVHQKASAANPAPLVCSLRTLLPETTVGPSADGSETQYEFTHALNPMDSCLQRNITADKILRTHKIVWSYDDNIDPESPEADEIEYRGRGKATANGEFVRNMKVGDTVTVWAKARYPGWVNNIDEVTIHVYWAV
jgi:hypothetical protein